MKLSITEKKEQTLLGRTHIMAHVSFEATTPSNVEMQKELATQLKTDVAHVIVRHIYSSFGSQQASVDALMYHATKDRDLYTVTPKKIRKANAKAKFDDVRVKATEKKTADATAKTQEA